MEASFQIVYFIISTLPMKKKQGTPSTWYTAIPLQNSDSTHFRPPILRVSSLSQKLSHCQRIYISKPLLVADVNIVDYWQTNSDLLLQVPLYTSVLLPVLLLFICHYLSLGPNVSSHDSSICYMYWLYFMFVYLCCFYWLHFDIADDDD